MHRPAVTTRIVRFAPLLSPVGLRFLPEPAEPCGPSQPRPWEQKTPRDQAGEVIWFIGPASVGERAQGLRTSSVELEGWSLPSRSWRMKEIPSPPCLSNLLAPTLQTENSEAVQCFRPSTRSPYVTRTLHSFKQCLAQLGDGLQAAASHSPFCAPNRGRLRLQARPLCSRTEVPFGLSARRSHTTTAAPVTRSPLGAVGGGSRTEQAGHRGGTGLREAVTLSRI